MRKIVTTRLLFKLSGGMLAFFAGTASAHTISLGYENSGPGSVTFWAGSYHSCGGGNEGGLTLSGANGTTYGPVSQSFTGGIVCTKPAALVDGVNNNTTSSYTSNIWQSVVFTGLTTGDYQFDFQNLNTTARFQLWDESLSSVFTLESSIVGDIQVPEPASALLLGTGLLAVGVARRRRRARIAAGAC